MLITIRRRWWFLKKKIPKRKTKIKIRRKGNSNTPTTAEPEELLLLQQQVLELIRSQAIQQIASADDSKYGTPEEQLQAINAGYRFLWSYGFDGDELRKGWRALSEWRA